MRKNLCEREVEPEGICKQLEICIGGGVQANRDSEKLDHTARDRDQDSKRERERHGETEREGKRERERARET